LRTIWYMGAKTRLTGEILSAVRAASPRARRVLDLMSGTAAVAHSLSPHYEVVANDVQAYATTIAAAYLAADEARGDYLAALDPVRDLGRAFRQNQDALLERLGPAIAVEDAFLGAYGLEPDTPDPLADGQVLAERGVGGRSPRRRLPNAPADRARAYRDFALQQTPTFLEERDTIAAGPFRPAADLFRHATIESRRRDPRAAPYLLASSYYLNVYLGLRQAIAVDSLRYAIDALRGPHALAKRRHYLAALLHAASVTTSATSHFCQPRGLVRDSEVKAVLVRRSLSIPSKTIAFSRSIAETVRGTSFRGPNAARQGSWRDTYAAWEAIQADVVYVDPPYTADNYSRFYHVLEVLTAYDYPRLHMRRCKTTKGRYPELALRYRSPFCIRSGVEQEVRDLVHETARRGAGLVFSYGEENGLLLKTWREAGDSRPGALRRLADLAREAYGEVELNKKSLLHSGQGDSNKQITELLLVARKPRRRLRA